MTGTSSQPGERIPQQAVLTYEQIKIHYWRTEMMQFPEVFALGIIQY